MTNNFPDKNARNQQIKELFRLIEEIQRFYHEKVNTQFIKIQENDLNNLVALMLAKSTNSLKAIQLLCKKGFTHDALMIARSIIENQVSASYILNADSENRAVLYIGFCDNKFRKQLQEMQVVNPSASQDQSFSLKYQDVLKEERAKVANRKNSWSLKSLREMADEDGQMETWKYYEMCCKMSHADVLCLNELSKLQKEEISVLPALAIVIQFYIIQLQVACIYFNFGYQKELTGFDYKRGQILAIR